MKITKYNFFFLGIMIMLQYSPIKCQNNIKKIYSFKEIAKITTAATLIGGLSYWSAIKIFNWFKRPGSYYETYQQEIREKKILEGLGLAMSDIPYLAHGFEEETSRKYIG